MTTTARLRPPGARWRAGGSWLVLAAMLALCLTTAEAEARNNKNRGSGRERKAAAQAHRNVRPSHPTYETGHRDGSHAYGPRDRRYTPDYGERGYASRDRSYACAPRGHVRDRHAAYGSHRYSGAYCVPEPRYSRAVPCDPWWAGAPVVYVERSPYYFNAGLGVYVGGVELNLNLGDCAPPGYAYYDPYCRTYMSTVAGYHEHLHRHHHPVTLALVIRS